MMNDETVSALLPIDNDLRNAKADALKCCATYIEEEFEDYDVNFSSKGSITEQKSNITTTKKTFWETLDEHPEDIDSSIPKFDKINNKFKTSDDLINRANSE